jgi:MATE family multidrug resistance protein
MVPGIVKRTFAAAGTWQGLVGASYALIPAVLIAAFARGASDNPQFRAVGVRMLILSAGWQLFDAAATTISEALRAAGDTAFTLWARTIIAWGIFTPGAYYSVRYLGWGDSGAMAWLALYLGLLAAVLFIRFRRGAWRRFELTEPLPPA